MNVTIALDVGTGSTRAAAMSVDGRVLAVAASEYDQIVPAHGKWRLRRRNGELTLASAWCVLWPLTSCSLCCGTA